MTRPKHAYKCTACASPMAVASTSAGTLDSGVEIIVRDLQCPHCGNTTQTVEVADRNFLVALLAMPQVTTIGVNMTSGPIQGTYLLSAAQGKLALIDKERKVNE